MPKKSDLVKPESFLSKVSDAQSVIDELIKTVLKENVDYGMIPGCKKPSMFKPGAEKMCFRFNLDAIFEKDVQTLEMLKTVDNLIAFKCILFDRQTGERVGEGRGSTVLGSRANCREPNNAVKIAEKSAQIDAVLRVFALSDRFTQDVEDMAKKDLNAVEITPSQKVVIDNTSGEVTISA